MKKYLIMALLALAAAGAFATDWVAGIVLDTVSGTSGSGSGSYWEGSRQHSYDYTVRDGGGAFGFFGSVGWKIFDINLAFFWGSASRKVTFDGDISEGERKGIEAREGAGKTTPMSAFQIGLWFKIPITFSRSFRLFPMFGADFNLGVKYGFGLMPGAGLGADFILFRNMFIRASAQGGFYSKMSPPSLNGLGLSFKVGAGWLL